MMLPTFDRSKDEYAIVDRAWQVLAGASLYLQSTAARYGRTKLPTRVQSPECVGAVMDELTPYLNCDVELELSGPNLRTMDKWAADALRTVADLLEKGEYREGFTDVKDSVGKKIGTVYVDYSERDEG